MTKLERLNQLLETEGDACKLPQHRRTVTESFSNLQWLQKNAWRWPSASEELRKLLSLNQKQLLEAL